MFVYIVLHYVILYYIILHYKINYIYFVRGNKFINLLKSLLALIVLCRLQPSLLGVFR